MKVHVLLFASYADALGADSLDVEVTAPASVRDLLVAVQRRASHAVPPSPMVAVNAEYASPDQLLSASDEIAIIPPVAGG